MKTLPYDLAEYNPINQDATGLTKREYMAIEFTKAIITGIVSGSGKDAHGWSCNDFSQAGLSQADSLIDALNKISFNEII